ncbi:PDZ domain-containing protein [Flammeovirga yaeyamensis]|uniref:PDZ domain-containing protein n=1 Tax=Flammeovirga yaeyamensis TaxID=367791 RepID=A0AAX1N4R7_9BACT|nr:PDZ domain-containing protein [Flammeovirga yaeyamensis]MBB3700359.1 hypothetical protein [Flammeovirga yaeyamensis]NMF37015.1 PDZ domain-containing protein [Flammeovirga yaeyamensis]QWG02442.1 PDZ domain-containing protein [Flammeovirga yaeyamensis]
MKTNVSKMMLLGMLFLIISPTIHQTIAQESKAHLKNLVFENERSNYVQIPFELINNLMIISVVINQSDSLKLILDTGVTYPIISDPNVVKSIGFDQRRVREIDIKGWGTKKDIIAYHSWGNTVNLDGIVGLNQDIIFANHDILLLSKNLGMHVHGLIGATIFNHFIVHIDYIKKKITLYDQDFYAKKRRSKFHKRYDKFPLEVNKNRSYIVSTAKKQGEETTYKLKLLVDTGASHALSILEKENSPMRASVQAIRDHLGVGINGDLYGKVSKLDLWKIGDFIIEDPIAKYPDFDVSHLNKIGKDRHGSIGSEILRRFSVVIDYKNQEILLRKNRDFKQTFQYNLLGLDFIKPFPQLPYYEVSQIREASPASKAGIKKGDRLLKVNGTSVSALTMEEVRNLFRGKHGQKLSLGIVSNSGESKKLTLTLEDPFKYEAND